MTSQQQEQHNFYQVLGIERSAADIDIDEAYEARLVACDELGNEPELDGLTQDDVKKIRSLLIQAYKTLRDPNKRATYDAEFFAQESGYETDIQEQNNLDLSVNNYELYENNNTDNSVAFVMQSDHNSNLSSESNTEANDLPESQKERTRRFTEFPSFPNMMEARQAANSVTPQGRLKKTMSLPAEAVEELTEAAREEMQRPRISYQEESNPVSAIEAATVQAEQGLDELREHFKPAPMPTENANSAPVSNKEKTSVTYVKQGATKTATQSHSRTSLEMPRSYKNSRSQGKNPALDFLLIFCAFVLPFGTLLFVIAYFMLG